MIKVDLITGFLGSGKTTFIKKYAKYHMDKGEKVGILENDYGAVNVDMLLLNELRGDNCELEMVAGACDSDCHKRRFKTKLISMGMCGYNRVIIEPSGVFDVDEFFDSLREEPLERWYEIGNVITIVDSRLDLELSEDSDFYLASQIANAGKIVFSRTGLVDSKVLAATKEHLKSACAKSGMQKDLDKLFFDKDWSQLNAADFDELANSGYSMSSYIKRTNGTDNDYSTVYFLELPITLDSMKSKIKSLFSDASFGKVLRIKGFIKENDKWFQINATKKELDIEPLSVGQEVFIVIGENLDQDKIKDFMEN